MAFRTGRDPALCRGSKRAGICDVSAVIILEVTFYWNRQGIALMRSSITTDEALGEFTRRAGGPDVENRNILAMLMERKSGEIALDLAKEQYAKLKSEVGGSPR
jgi:hypothetical protein